ncbi:nuclear transport factor 2 family protein [Streptomyces sp. ISL-100]|uniref:nuclear transport factor 2 family protein n=1 Tax=Streptomyces sp. ISL-100 TaxID=2819173 RepID=UPI001BEB8131|nr:nuclear transport factor 2 family protein [Streptomyces sp. ISL-100]MBT2400621.1 nuclear transport factor 2 family protein [Streptomyces sp. ISL-100]
MTQRVELATVMDRLAIDAVITGYAVAVDDANWLEYRALFTPDGRADYRTAGGIEGPAAEVAVWLMETMRLFPVRQHLIVNRRLRLEDLNGDTGDRAELQADYVNPMRLETAPAARKDDGSGPSTEPNFMSGGRYAFSLLRTEGGWRLRSVVVREKWRRTTGSLDAR